MASLWDVYVSLSKVYQHTWHVLPQLKCALPRGVGRGSWLLLLRVAPKDAGYLNLSAACLSRHCFYVCSGSAFGIHPAERRLLG
jgi:hypothetical protein